MPFGKPSYCEPLTKEPPKDWECMANSGGTICPYCGEEDENAHELGSGGEEDGETECGFCNRPFRYSRRIDVNYTTEPIIGPHPEETKP